MDHRAGHAADDRRFRPRQVRPVAVQSLVGGLEGGPPLTRMLSSLGPVVFLSLYVSGAALAIAAVIGVPAGARLALYPLPGQRAVDLLIYTGMGLPPVVVGLAVYLLLSRSGPLGGLGLVFSPAGMVHGP